MLSRHTRTMSIATTARRARSPSFWSQPISRCRARRRFGSTGRSSTISTSCLPRTRRPIPIPRASSSSPMATAFSFTGFVNHSWRARHLERPVPADRVAGMIRPRRSVLYMPGSNARALEKARTLAADGVILDLEDSVAPDAKETARRQVAEAVKAGGFGHREVFIRINATDTPWHADDLSAAAPAAPDAILIPKVSSPDTLELVGRRLLDMATDHKTRVWAMVETPLALFNILAIAAEARDSESRLAGLIMGTNDLAKDTRARLGPGRAPID